MAELEQQGSRADPIASLHKMSATAGIALQDYVAINPLAITSAALGAASALGFIATPFLLLGAAGIVLGVIAVLQVRHSNGTQAGTSLAIGGVVLCVVIGAGVIASAVKAEMAVRREKRIITPMVQQFGRYVMGGDNDAAYAMFDPEFQYFVRAEDFQRDWKARQDPLYGGKLLVLEGNDEYTSFIYAPDGRVTTLTGARIRFTRSIREERIVLTFRKGLDGQWRIWGFADWYDQYFRKKPRPATKPS